MQCVMHHESEKLYIDISQGNVVMHLRRGGICSDDYCKFPDECASERV